MRKGRITKTKAAEVWCLVTRVLQGTKLNAVTIPRIDIDAIFGDRKSMTTDNVIGEISRCIDAANAD
jgi:hypothetical protein